MPLLVSPPPVTACSRPQAAGCRDHPWRRAHIGGVAVWSASSPRPAEEVAGRVRPSRNRLLLRPAWALLSAAPPIGMVNRLVEGVDEEAGDPLRLLVRDEVAGARDGDQGCARTCLECGPFLSGEPAVA